MSSKAGTSQVSTSLNEGFLVDSLMGSEKIDISRKITDLTRKLNMMETRYYKQFTAMETAINKFNSQAGSFSSFL
jgi:flagellar hook-associated protein 2